MAAIMHSTEIPWSLGDTIDKARRTAGLTHDQLAEMLHMSRATLYNWEADKHRPSARKIRAVAQATGVPVEWFAPWLGGGGGITTSGWMCDTSGRRAA